ncbi:fat-like protein cadherin-related tumor suppressor-like protein [Dinothrombium tinctorium]|uniref:Fat-like protein cadherin-related tumor suppressor-like protein n=1 Tax=Dinothrombium tinctorium TaxID=1965070 RepID=A0A443RF04_9ACAR|nr:fat-like protein cadherin-related tumor suppressor-like protein [Dinothrombium tinctorium]
MNDGTCVPLSNGSYECLCPSRYSGKHCEIDLNPCASNPCTNGATCINDLENCPDKVNCYKCNCRAENTGTNCEKLRYCSPNNPCANEGICEETMHGVICRCQRGFHGYYCEHDIDECSSPITVCPPPATCFNLRGSYRCICPLANLNSTLPCSGDNLLTTDKTLFSSPHSDLILLGIIVIIVIIVTLLVVCICLRCHICHKKSRNVPTSAAVYHAVTNNEFCHKNSVTDAVNLNRISKLSNYDMNAMVTYGDQNYQMHPRQRPTSVVDPLNDLTGARNTDSSEVDFENVGQTHLGRDQSDFVQQLRKTNAPPVASISPQIVESSQMPNAENKIQNSK